MKSTHLQLITAHDLDYDLGWEVHRPISGSPRCGNANFDSGLGTGLGTGFGTSFGSGFSDFNNGKILLLSYFLSC